MNKLKIKKGKSELRGDITFFLGKNRGLTMTPEARTDILGKLSKLELWLVAREVRDDCVSNLEITEVFEKFGIELTKE